MQLLPSIAWPRCQLGGTIPSLGATARVAGALGDAPRRAASPRGAVHLLTSFDDVVARGFPLLEINEDPINIGAGVVVPFLR